MFKFCSVSTVIGWNGQTVTLRANSVWRADDPLVKAHPEWFTDAPEVVETSAGAVYRSVESVTARPGEKRGR